MSPRVDVVLPNYNKVEHIDECLSSLKQQTFENWRCIVIDGYSDDGSWERIQEAADGDDRFELHRLGRIGLKHLTSNQIVEEAPEGSEGLFDGRGGPVVLFDVSGDVDRLNIG